MHHLPATVLALTVLGLLLAGCDSGEAEEPATATLSGVVRHAETNAPMAEVKVSVGSLEVITDQDGSFSFSDVPTGPAVLVEASAPGFESYNERIAVQAGGTVHDIFLVRKTLFEMGSFLAYVPPDISSPQAVLFMLPGQNDDMRRFVSGEVTQAVEVDIWQRVRAFAETHALVVLGFEYLGDNTNDTYEQMADALTQLAGQSGFAEVEEVPLLFMGHSAGGCHAYGITRQRSERVIGFISSKGGCHRQLDGGPAQTVPAYLFIGQDDRDDNNENIEDFFVQNRADAALWAVAVEPGSGHYYVADVALQIEWMETVLRRRLPETPGPLLPLDEADGWLGNRTTHVIAPYACYEGDKLAASWLPSEQTARDWQHFVSLGEVTEVTTCANEP